MYRLQDFWQQLETVGIGQRQEVELQRKGLGSRPPGIIIIIFIYCNWVITRWQWLFYM